jgi:hypothetical protein
VLTLDLPMAGQRHKVLANRATVTHGKGRVPGGFRGVS